MAKKKNKTGKAAKAAGAVAGSALAQASKAKVAGDLDAAAKSTEKASKKSDKSSKSSSKLPNIGDKVQIIAGTIDVTNGAVCAANRPFAEGQSDWLTVVAIKKKWKTESKYGLPKKITKIDLAMNSGGAVIWHCQAASISKNKINKNKAAVKTGAKVVNSVASSVLSYISGGSAVATSAAEAVQMLKAALADRAARAAQVDTALMNVGYATVDGLKSSKWKSGTPTRETIKRTNKKQATDASKTKTLKKSSAGMELTKYTKLLDSIVIPNMYTKLILFDYDKNRGKYVNDIPSSVKSAYVQRYVDPKGNIQNEVRLNPSRRVLVQELNKNPSTIVPDFRRIMFKDDPNEIQNAYKFPFTSDQDAATYQTDDYLNCSRRYDYQFIPGDPRLPSDSPIKNLEQRLAAVRADLGIPVHGNMDLARSMKMYLYNRYKTADRNLAHSKSFTHVFFTRPDVNLLTKDSSGKITINNQAKNHTDSAFLWKRHPELFKLLTDSDRCGDSHNFNLLLSNQVTSFTINNEGINTHKSQRSWNDHEMVYGETYNGKVAGEFSVSFDETSEYSILNFIKLWITYIANVSNGAWSPYYPNEENLKLGLDGEAKCHVFDRAMDYGASVYVFKCGPDGEDVLYWTKYYGVFPIATGTEALTWDKSNPIGDIQRITIPFAYCFKSEWSPVSLIEFNDCAKIDPKLSTQPWIPAWDPNLGSVSRPFVGCPFVEITLAEPSFVRGDDVARGARTHIRLKYKPDPLGGRLGKGDLEVRSDRNLYQFSLEH